MHKVSRLNEKIMENLVSLFKEQTDQKKALEIKLEGSSQEKLSPLLKVN